MIELIFWIFAGCIAGTITGLIPGLHINTVSFLLLLLTSTKDTNFAVMIVAMAIVHSFVDFIPSILLGAPDSDSFLSILPGHYFLLKGDGLAAIKFTIIGGIFSTAFSILLLPFFLIFVIKLNEFFQLIIPWILISSLILMISTQKEEKKYVVLVIFFASVLGIVGLQSHLSANPLFSLVTGFFAGSTIIYSLQKNESISIQKNKKINVKASSAIKGIILSSFSAAIVSIIPSIGPSQAAFLLKQFVGKISKTQYLIILGGIGTANFLFTFFFLFLTGSTRTGSAVALKELIELNNSTLFLIIITVIISAGVGAIITDTIAKKVVFKIHLLNYSKINKLVFGFLFFLSFFLSGIFGLVLFISATATGLIALTSGIKRTSCMAFLMVPTILFYLQ